MLSQLYIKNLAVVKEASIDLTAGLNVFTGETGAGKSVIIGAIAAILGGRMHRDQVRTGESKACVSALFTDLGQRARDMLEEKGFAPDEDGCLLITREFSADGRNNCRINTRPATISVLKEIGMYLIDLHGQRDNNRLLLPEYQMELIDSFGRLEEQADQYRLEYRQLSAIQKEIRSLQMNEAEKEQKIDLLKHQLREIRDAELTPGEEEELVSQRRKIQNSERILSGLAEAKDSLSGDESGEYTGAVSLLETAASSLEAAGRFLPDIADIAERIQEIVYELQETERDISDQLDDMDYNPAQLDEIEERLDEIYRLKRKYGSSYQDIMVFYKKAQEQLRTITSADERIKKLQKELKTQQDLVNRLAKSLSDKRMEAGKDFVSQVEAELTFLDMPAVRLLVQNETHLSDMDGIDRIAFLISANQGEQPKPLSRIASGGELSRIMLAVKNIMWSRDDAGTMIFDEVDSGVSGRAAQKIGRKLSQAASSRQVICVTHLAQIASCGDSHMLIRKEAVDGQTFTRVSALEGQQRLEELARIISGENITDASLRTAKEMLETAQAERADFQNGICLGEPQMEKNKIPA